MKSPRISEWSIVVAGVALAGALERTLVAVAASGGNPGVWIVVSCAVAAIVIAASARSAPETLPAAAAAFAMGLAWAAMMFAFGWLLHASGLLSVAGAITLLTLHALAVGILYGVVRQITGRANSARLLVGSLAGFCAGTIAVIILALVQILLGAFLLGDSMSVLFVLSAFFVIPATMLGAAISAWIGWRARARGETV
jgi:hypothetical protein